MIHLTRIDNDGKKPLTKKFEIREGKLHKTTAAYLIKGRANQVEVASIRELANIIRLLEPYQALMYGVAEERTVRIVTDAELCNNPGAIARTRKHFSFRQAPAIMLLDYDPPPDASPITAAQLRNRLISVHPDLVAAPMLAVASASSYIYEGDIQHRGSGGWHIYMTIASGSDIERAGNALYERCWLTTVDDKRLGYYLISKSGQFLDRSLIDRSVWQPERLDFAAGSLCTPPLTQRRPDFQVWNADAPLFDTQLILSLSAQEKELAKQNRDTARAALGDERTAKRDAYRSEQIKSLGLRGIGENKAGDIIDQAINHSALLGDFVLTMSDGAQVTVAEVLADTARFHRMRFADPLEPDYRKDSRVAYANLYSGGRPFIYSHAHGGQRYELFPQQRTLQLHPGERPRQTDRAIELMKLAADVYNRSLGGGRYSLVYVREAQIIEADEAWLRDYLGRLVKCERFNRQRAQWEPADIPLDLVKAILGRRTIDRDLPKLDLVVSDPVMRLDGSVLNTPGFCAQDGLLFVSDEIWTAQVPMEPSEGEAKEAFETVWKAFKEFPFADGDARAVLLAALVTIVMRPMLPTSPAFAFDAPKAGSGKTLLADCICALCGIHAPVSPPPKDDEEAKKMLFAALRNGARVILWDNYTQPIYGNAAICAFLTASHSGGRVLGRSEEEILPNHALVIFTGNNLRVQGDACRRVLMSRIDSETERPESRSFDLAPAQYVRQRRTEIRLAIFTLMRCFHRLGLPKQTKDTAGSFEDWDKHVRQFIVWLGKSGHTRDIVVGDPFKTAQANLENDFYSDSLGDFIRALRELFGDRSFTAAQALSVFELSTDRHREAFESVQGDRPFNSKGLGRWLQKNRDVPVDGLKIVAIRDRSTKTFSFSIKSSRKQTPIDPLML